ncbi:MAG: 16S rRNA (adenine(1518)-N(6)/adenine(1519)-N(6))-dimethyltransferase RsmA [Fibromonadaceae bacterium]|jgi:16S rRNA (adenine1518-N6/adenine1519-N6)-dimethyltransferase|nr:16S rRNA (adenine(1518)-N(6)/adenine(1519)-N(6))-dimethyltransferase RsmA [Fibromonadaceae bacterium]
MLNIKTRRRFGQNFLDAEMSRKIADDLPCQAQDSILEIGPGHGALTAHLLPKCLNLTAVEIDNFCIPKLLEKFKNKQNFNLEHKNFLQFNIEEWANENPNSWLVGNLPYNMATAIISHILPHISKTKGCMFMTQAEVAQRITAISGSKSYGSFSVFCACYAKSRIVRFIGPEHFRPKPKVNSATIFLEPLEKPLCVNENFLAFVRAAFSQKRKTLVNSLSSTYPKEKIANILKKLNLSENSRAEELPLEIYFSIFGEVCFS